MITETLARSMTREELAARLEDHDDIAVRVLIEKISNFHDLSAKVEELEEELSEERADIEAWERWLADAPR